MHLHVVLISLFEPFQHTNVSDQYERPSKVVAQSKACFETLVRLYYLRHGFESYDITLLQFIPMLAFGSLRDIRHVERGSETYEEIRSTLLLCAKGLRDQGRNMSSGEATFRLLQEDANRENVPLLHEGTVTSEQDDRLSLLAKEMRSGWPVGVFSKTTDTPHTSLSRYLKWWELLKATEQGQGM